MVSLVAVVGGPRLVGMVAVVCTAAGAALDRAGLAGQVSMPAKAERLGWRGFSLAVAAAEMPLAPLASATFGRAARNHRNSMLAPGWRIAGISLTQGFLSCLNAS